MFGGEKLNKKKTGLVAATALIVMLSLVCLGVYANGERLLASPLQIQFTVQEPEPLVNPIDWAITQNLPESITLTNVYPITIQVTNLDPNYAYDCTLTVSVTNSHADLDPSMFTMELLDVDDLQFDLYADNSLLMAYESFSISADSTKTLELMFCGNPNMNGGTWNIIFDVMGCEIV